jgi:hypothetical protein
MPRQPAYAAPAFGYAPAPGYAPGGQQGFRPPAPQAAAPPPQPVPYPPQQPYMPQPLPQEYAMRPKRRPGGGWLPACLLGVLPLLFVATLLFAMPALKWAFIGLAGLCLLVMWAKQSFVPSARTTLTLVYGALILVCAVSLITASAPRDQTTSAQGGGSVSPGLMATSPTGSPDPLAQTGMGSNPGAQQQPPAATPVPNSGENSAAWQRLQQFFSFWSVNNTENMLGLVSPEWASAQEIPAKSLFLVLTNRVPMDYAFENISGTDADSSRTVTMTSTIDKKNGRDPVKIRFQVLMLQQNGEWYVDPNSLASNEVVSEAGDLPEEDQDASASSATSKPTATPAPQSKLYFNDEGGKYYHAQSDCSTVAVKYLPLTSFYYRDLNSTKFKNLLPCTTCNAPQRP